MFYGIVNCHTDPRIGNFRMSLVTKLDAIEIGQGAKSIHAIRLIDTQAVEIIKKFKAVLFIDMSSDHIEQADQLSDIIRDIITERSKSGHKTVLYSSIYPGTVGYEIMEDSRFREGASVIAVENHEGKYLLLKQHGIPVDPIREINIKELVDSLEATPKI